MDNSHLSHYLNHRYCKPAKLGFMRWKCQKGIRKKGWYEDFSRHTYVIQKLGKKVAF